MNFVKLTYDGIYYKYNDASNSEMNSLGNLLAIDVGCYWPSFREWALDSSLLSASSNATSLIKKHGYIYIDDLYAENQKNELKISVQQFTQLLDDWQEKVCVKRPNNVVIKHEKGQFVIETSD